jgi:hypothetical protein
MNEQPAVWVGNLFAFVFILMIICFAIKGYNDPKNKIRLSDSFTIGYSYDVPLNKTSYCQVKSNVSQATKKTKTNNNTTSKTKVDQLQLDCIDALVALGMKKNQAKHRYNDVSQNYTFNNIQEFLTLALSKP